MNLTEWIDELRDMVRRRRMLILGVAVLGAVFSVMFAASQAHQYRSVAVLQVQTAKVAGDLAQSAASGATARHLQLVQQRIMSRAMVREIAAELDLLDDLAGMTETEQVVALRDAVTIEGVEAASDGTRDDGAVSLVRISAEWIDRESAKALAAEVADRTIALSRDSRLERAQETLSFFSLREDQLQEQIATLEDEIAAFRRENQISAPGGVEARQREMETLRDAILSIDQEMIAVESRLEQVGDGAASSRVIQRRQNEIREELDNLSKQRAYLTDNLDALTETGQRGPEVQLQQARYDQRMDDLRAELQDVRDKRKAAEVAHQLETHRQSEHFTLLEPASRPDYPFTPSRKKMATMGSFASLLAGLGLAFLLELRRPVVRSAALMQRDLGHRPIVTVPQAAASRPRRGGLLRRLRRRGTPA
ncbi:Wzz/FepE/Etk N-terminal domain-containing protein [Roseovarius salinarum]|uniref:Wzz/FepE/Etk N-terminal domain-containing protein n=1 Tax=Roseovarius salinarum TaxID=1981892 RepID=UPI000C33F61A|nr:Wzz/FepE/Etk N-terminal domain-containing protein [Roseovarius salinarum]